ncbi:MAG TPA: 2-octaprenyl-6-methoxyphenyl hydroxylase [Xanthomonadaceae bacterium]|jgi:2-octaprenyl-6-methoxyphenol hydroxylase|nr:2-octaprenyl-6-methoxyphenyl hydroxylase [Xanthomonadaceae bacterium]
MTDDIHDVLIIGGGLVGASLACALDGSGLDVALVESESPRASVRRDWAEPDSDARSLALAAASLNALAAIGVLRHLSTPPAPIRRIHVSRRGDFGAVLLRAEEYGRDAFGGVVPAPALGIALQSRLRELHGLRHETGAKLVALRESRDLREADIVRDGTTTTLRARLVVGADGTASFVRDALGIGATTHDYAQHLFAGSVRASHPAAGQAWERFTDDGPMALLPRASGPHLSDTYGCICTVPAADADRIGALDEAGFLALLQQRFGWRAGRFVSAGRRSGHPLRQLVAERLVASRAVVMGNAAQTLHPIGAQGFNLGLRDALTLAELVRDARMQGGDTGGGDLLDEYVRRRVEDREQTLRFSDGLARITSNPAMPMRLLRSLAMGALGALPGARANLAGGAMGFRGVVPELAHGVRTGNGVAG